MASEPSNPAASHSIVCGACSLPFPADPPPLEGPFLLRDCGHLICGACLEWLKEADHSANGEPEGIDCPVCERQVDCENIIRMFLSGLENDCTRQLWVSVGSSNKLVPTQDILRKYSDREVRLNNLVQTLRGKQEENAKVIGALIGQLGDAKKDRDEAIQRLATVRTLVDGLALGSGSAPTCASATESSATRKAPELSVLSFMIVARLTSIYR
ncbi:hypothetical protein C8Q73DRAFT_696684 [Cubamyces lactineus]|nr:hypothetical protein C8Q73DRAFT_696684 [Cubamyces lactineus]